jgi:beta-xylosidase
MKLSRRTLLSSLPLIAAPPAIARAATPETGAAGVPCRTPGDWSHLQWARGVEGQRKADLGDGRFLNPIMPGDHPDPSILKDGDDYYMTFSSFDAYPGIVIWHSRDLVNWQPVTAALKTPIGSVWAPELCRHQGRYYVYIPARFPDYRSNYVIWADDIRGPWSEPVDLELPDHIDPGHVVDTNGDRYLALSGGDIVPLTPDGLATAGPVRHVYDPWRYPEDWVVESFSPEGPKMLRHGDWFYMITAVGGTAGPPTGHMVIVARSKSLDGPWEDAPNNPIVRTESAHEKWWSRGHATLVEEPGGDWWMVYHGYENGFWTLGRQCLLAPVAWTDDGWIRAGGGDLSAPLSMPQGGSAVPHGQPLSDDFSTSKFGTQWGFYAPGPREMQRVRLEDQALVVSGKGSTPADCSPLTFIAGDLAYEVTVQCEVSGDAWAGLLLFYNRRLYCGLGYSKDGFVMHRYGLERRVGAPAGLGRRLWLRITNDRNIVTIHHSPDGEAWTRFYVQMEVSGYHHNVAYDFLSLRPGIYAAGDGEVRFRNLAYRALP